MDVSENLNAVQTAADASEAVSTAIEEAKAKILEAQAKVSAAVQEAQEAVANVGTMIEAAHRSTDSARAATEEHLESTQQLGHLGAAGHLDQAKTYLEEAVSAHMNNSDSLQTATTQLTEASETASKNLGAVHAGLEESIANAAAAHNGIDQSRVHIQEVQNSLTSPSSSVTVAAAPSQAQRASSSAASWAALVNYRRQQGMPSAGSPQDGATAAMLKVGGQSFFGRNAHKRTIDIKVNSITRTHAEADVFQQLKDSGSVPKQAEMYVDRDLCPPCGPSGGVGSLMRGAGVEVLIVHSPSGTFRIDATKRPSRPVRLAL